MSSFVWHEKESRRSAHSRKKLERETKAQDAEVFLSSVTSGVDLPPFDLILGDCEQHLDVPEGCIGLLIGKKGEHLKAVEQKFKVTVKIDKDEKSGQNSALITGTSPNNVAAATKELDFRAWRKEVPPEMAGWICGKSGRHLKLVREMTGVVVLSLVSEGGEADQEGEDGADDAAAPPKRCWLEVKGLRDQVDNARMCLEAHMSYHSVFQEMDEVERDLDRQIASARGRISRRPVASGSSSGAADGGEGGTRARSGSPTRPRSKPRNQGQAQGAQRREGSSGRGGRTRRVWTGVGEGAVGTAGAAYPSGAADGARGGRGRGGKARGGRGIGSGAIGASTKVGAK